MNKTRVSKLLVSAALIVVSFMIATQTFRPYSSAENSSRPVIGMGDLHRIEAQANIPAPSGQESSRSIVGMGDLHRFEMEQANILRDALESGRPHVGMGDLRRFEAQQSDAATNLSSSPLSGHVYPD